MMQVGEVKCAEDVDFERLKQLCRCHDGWKQDYNKNSTTVCSKTNDVSDFKLIKVREFDVESLAVVPKPHTHTPCPDRALPGVRSTTETDCR